MKKFLSFMLAAVMLLSLAACGQQSNTDAQTDPDESPEVEETSKTPKTIVDTYGNEFTLPMKLDKVIIINSAVYEMFCILGKEDTVIGVGDSIVYPKSALTKDKYGDWREPNTELILEAEPDAVIGYSSWLDSGIAQQLTDAGIAVIMLDLYVPSNIITEIEFLGQLLGAEDCAAKFSADLMEIQELVAEKTADVEPISIYYEGYSEYKSVGKGSGGTELMELANVASLTAEEEVSYPKISDEWLVEENPQMIFKMVSTTKEILGEDIEDNTVVKELYSSICSRPGWESVDAVKNGKILILSSRIGTTPLGIAMAPLYIAKTAYPEEFEDINPEEYVGNMLEKYWGEEMTGIWSYTE